MHGKVRILKGLRAFPFWDTRNFNLTGTFVIASVMVTCLRKLKDS